MSDETAVVVQDYDVRGTALEAWGQRAEVREAANRLMSFHPAAKEVGKPGMLAAAHLALMVGASPLPSTNEIHVFVNKGRVTVDLGVNYFRRRARDLGGILWEFEPRLMTPDEYRAYGVDPDTHLGAICRACRVSDVKLLMDVLGVPADLAFTEAMKRSGRTGVGTVGVAARAKEGRPLSWTACKAAEKDICRALFPNLEAPTREEQAAILESIPHAEPDDHEWAGPTLNGQEAESLAHLREDTQRATEEMEDLTPEEQAERLEENADTLGQPPEDFEGFDPPEAPPEPDDPEPQPQAVAVPRSGHSPEVIRRTCRYHAGWKKGDDPDWADAFRPDPPPSDPIGEELLASVAAALNNAIGKGTEKQKADKRHAVYRYLFGMSSGKALTMKEGAAILRWIGLPDAQKMGEIRAMAPTEVQAVAKAAEVASGQLELGV